MKKITDFIFERCKFLNFCLSHYVFNSYIIKDKEKIIHWLDTHGVGFYSLALDDKNNWVVDVHEKVYLDSLNLYMLPIKFNSVSKDFSISYSNLFSLQGCPNNVGESFDCSNNRLKSLEGGPITIGATYNCRNNRLKSLKGCPEKVLKFDCSYNQLKSLECGPSLAGDYDASSNHLITLKGSPNIVNQFFSIGYNKLTNLEHGPKEVGISYECTNNKLEHLKFLPEKVGNGILLRKNPLLLKYQALNNLSDILSLRRELEIIEQSIQLKNDLDVQFKPLTKNNDTPNITKI